MGMVMRPEEGLHRAVVQLLQIYANRGLLAFCHVPNGGRRTRAEAGVLKAMGTTPGGHFAIELKAGRRAVLSDAQVVWHSTLESLGHRVYLCRSVDDVERCLRAEGVPPVGKLAVVISADGPKWVR
jgi:hypothetical protein